MKWLYKKWVAHMKRSKEKALKVVKHHQYLYGTGFLEKCWWGYRAVHPVNVFICKNRPTSQKSEPGCFSPNSRVSVFHKNCNYMYFLDAVCTKCGQLVTKDITTSEFKWNIQNKN